MNGTTPVIFTAHGNPMNALGGSPFAAFLARWGDTLPRPATILCVSAHWERIGLAVTAAERPETVHDFWGFPDRLFRLRYPAPGSPALARRVRELLAAAGVACELDGERGLDHGAWAPLLHLFPRADAPVLQLSLPAGGRLDGLAAIGGALAPLRSENVLVVASGNLVHNLFEADLRRRDRPVPAWAERFDAWVRDRLLAHDVAALEDPWRHPDGKVAHPTLEHWAPLLVALGAAGQAPVITFPFEGFEHGTVGLRCVAFD